MTSRPAGLPTVDERGFAAGPLLVFGGPYGNLQAMQALLAEAGKLGIPPDRMMCTGDLVAYCADPAATVALVRAAGIPVVKGNVEESLGAAAADCGCGFAEGSTCDLLAAQWYAYAAARLDGETLRWMAGLPDRIEFDLAGLRFAAVHGALSSINRFVFPATPDADIAAELAGTDADVVIGGHSGLPFARTWGTRLWCNAGALGLPANDGTPRVWYAILAAAGDGIAVSFRALDYDHDAAARAVRAADLPEAYADTLQSGIWPNDDIMPDADRGRRGVPLAPAAFRLSAAAKRVSIRA